MFVLAKVENSGTIWAKYVEPSLFFKLKFVRGLLIIPRLFPRSINSITKWVGYNEWCVLSGILAVICNIVSNSWIKRSTKVLHCFRRHLYRQFHLNQCHSTGGYHLFRILFHDVFWRKPAFNSSFRLVAVALCPWLSAEHM